MSDQLPLPYKHPSNTLTTIPRAIRRLTRSGRRTATQIEAVLLKAGVKGRRTVPCKCIIANHIRSLTGIPVSVGTSTIRDVRTDETWPLGIALCEVRGRFDYGLCKAALYEGGVA